MTARVPALRLLAAASLAAATAALGPGTARADVLHAPGKDAAAWAAYLEYSLTGRDEALDRLAEARGETSFVALEQALAAARRGDRARMLERAQRSAELDPDNGEAHAFLSRAWFRLAEEGLTNTETLQRAVEHAEAALRLDTADPDILDRLAEAHGVLAARAERAGDAETALRERGLERGALEAWAERFRHEAAWRRLADLARELGDLAGEAQALDETLRRGDDPLLTAQRLGDVLSELGRCEAALPILEEALGAAKADRYAGISLAVQLGDCAARAGDPLLSESAFRRALDLDPTNLIAVSGLAEAQWQQGRHSEAAATLDDGGARLARASEIPAGDARPGASAEQRLDWLATRARWKAAHDLPDALDDARKALALAESTGTPRQRALMATLVAEAHLGRGELEPALEAARAATRHDPSHEPALMTLLNAAWSRGVRGAVLDEIEKLPEAQPAAGWHVRLARWAAGRGFDALAIRHARKALEEFKGPPGLRAELEVETGEALLAAGDPASAERLGRAALRVRPWDEAALFLVVEALTTLGRGAEADAELEAVVAARGEDPWLLERWSSFEQQRRRMDEAVARARRALELSHQGSPHPAEAARFQLRLGEALLAAGRAAEAVEMLQVAGAATPLPTFEVLLAEARSLAKAGRAADALARVEVGLARQPNDDLLGAERGRLLLVLGRTDDGIAALTALLRDPRALAGRHGQVALALVEAGQEGKGLEVAASAIERFPLHAGLHLTAARVSEQAGRRDEAEARFRRALQLDPESPVALNALGYTLADWNLKVEEAVRLLRRAVELRPHEAAYLDSLGWALYRAGKLDEAARHLEAGLARDRDPVILAHLGRVMESQGRGAEAEALLREALAAGLEEGEDDARSALKRVAAPAAASSPATLDGK